MQPFTAVDTPTAPDRWGILTEVSAAASDARERVFTLQHTDQTECYYLTHCRRFGANKCHLEGQARPASPSGHPMRGRWSWSSAIGTAATSTPMTAVSTRSFPSLSAQGRRDRYLVDRRRGRARTGGFRGARSPALHVSHYPRRRLGGLPHRPLLPLPDRHWSGGSGARFVLGRHTFRRR